MSITDRDLLFLTAQGTDSLSPRNPILPSRPTIDPASTFRIGEEAIELKEDPLGMTRRAESLGAAREHDESLLGPVGTPDSGSASQSSMRLPNQGEAAARIAAVEKLLDDVLDDRREIAIGPPSPFRGILSQKNVLQVGGSKVGKTGLGHQRGRPILSRKAPKRGSRANSGTR